MRPADSSTPPVVPRYTPPTLKLPLLISALLLVLLAIGWQLRDPAGSATSADASNVIGDEGDERTEVEAIEAGLAISTIDVVVRAGDSLDRIFRQLELSLQDLAAMRALPELRRQLDRLYPGETLTFSLREGSDTQAAELLSLERKLSLSETLTITRAAEGFSSDVIVNPLERTIHTTEGEILQSLFVAASRAGLSDSMAMQIADVFRWDIDFVLDIRPGDRFRLTYEKLSQDGVSVGDGNLLALPW